MNRIIIEIPQFMNITLKVKNISDAVKKLINLENIYPKKKEYSIEKFKGIAKYEVKDEQYD